MAQMLALGLGVITVNMIAMVMVVTEARGDEHQHE